MVNGCHFFRDHPPAALVGFHVNLQGCACLQPTAGVTSCRFEEVVPSGVARSLTPTSTSASATLGRLRRPCHRHDWRKRNRPLLGAYKRYPYTSPKFELTRPKGGGQWYQSFWCEAMKQCCFSRVTMCPLMFELERITCSIPIHFLFEAKGDMSTNHLQKHCSKPWCAACFVAQYRV